MLFNPILSLFQDKSDVSSYFSNKHSRSILHFTIKGILTSWLILLSTFLCRRTRTSKAHRLLTQEVQNSQFMFVSTQAELRRSRSPPPKQKKHKRQINSPPCHLWVTILSRQTLLSCGPPVLHHLFNPTLPKQKHFYFPNRHHPSSSTKANKNKNKNKNKKATFQTSTNKIKQDQSNNHRSQGSIHTSHLISSHLISSHEYDCYRAWNELFLSFFLTPLTYPTCIYAFSKLF